VTAVALAVKVGNVVISVSDLAVSEAVAATPEAPPRMRPPPPPPVDTDTLEALAKRRAELDKRAEEIREREIVLEATEKRVDEKIARLREIERSIESANKQRDAEEEARIKSLVKIYEAMKPKEAARVFEQLEMPVLLTVLEGMKELKSAPILAAMEPGKVKAVTVALAARGERKQEHAAAAR